MSNYSYILLHSDDSFTGEPSNSSFNLTNFQQANAFKRIALNQIIVPNLQFPVNTRNNTLIFQEDGVATDLTATITAGSYNAVEFATIIKTAMDTAGANTYTITYDDNAFAYTIATSGTSVKLMSSSTALKVLGFDERTDTAFSASLTSNYPVRLDGTQYIDIICSLPTRNTTSDNRPTFIRIPVQVGFGGIIYWEASVDNWIEIHDQIPSLDIRLTTDDGGIMDLPRNASVQYTFKLESP